MIKTRFILAGVAATTALSMGAIGIANADTTSGGNIGTSGISKTEFKQDKLEAVAEVLNTTTANISTAHSDKDLKQLISNAGLTRQSFKEKVKAQLTTELESQGYTQDQITVALQKKTIHHLRHDKK